MRDDQTAWYADAPYIRSAASHDVIAEVVSLAGQRSATENQANLRLIAAAPELLAACRYVLPSLVDADEDDELGWGAEIDRLRAAIAKAIGPKARRSSR